MQRWNARRLSRKALKAQYLGCLSARSPASLRHAVQGLIRLAVGRDLLLAWAVAERHDRKYVGKLLSECLTALGLRQRRPGGGRRPAPAALVLLAFAHELFRDKEQKVLRAAWRASKGQAATQLRARGFQIIPELELYIPAVARFASRLAEPRNIRTPYEQKTL